MKKETTVKKLTLCRESIQLLAEGRAVGGLLASGEDCSVQFRNCRVTF